MNTQYYFIRENHTRKIKIDTYLLHKEMRYCRLSLRILIHSSRRRKTPTKFLICINIFVLFKHYVDYVSTP